MALNSYGYCSIVFSENANYDCLGGMFLVPGYDYGFYSKFGELPVWRGADITEDG